MPKTTRLVLLLCLSVLAATGTEPKLTHDDFSAVKLTFRYAAGCDATHQDGLWSQTLTADRSIDGIICFEPESLDKNRAYEFSCHVEASTTGIAYLQAKLYRDGKETKRINSARNAALTDTLHLVTTPGDSDKLEVLCRIIHKQENLGQTVRWRNIFFGPARHHEQLPVASEPVPRLEIVPGYQMCSIYLNHCQAEDDATINGQIQYREKNTPTWRPALPPAYVRHEKSWRVSLLNLRENTEYEVRVTVDDDGRRVEIIRGFRTKTPSVPVAKTVVLSANQANSALHAESGTEDGYIRYTASPGVILNVGKTQNEAVLLENCSYVILDGLTIRGGKKNGVMIRNSHHIHVLNCDIAGYGQAGTFRPDLDGKHYVDGQPVWRDAGIHVLHSDNVLIERNYIHDPDSLGNSWFYSHPSGPNGICVNDSAAFTVRYNDLIGSDAKRWDDSVGSRANFSKSGGAKRDAEIGGNYFAFGNDDGVELDGGQMNARFFHNRVEGFFCGVSLANCMRGPSYVFQNEFVDAGDAYDFGGHCIKMISGVSSPWGPVYLLHNDILWEAGGLSAPHRLPKDKTPAFLLYARGNRHSDPEPYRTLQNRNDFRSDIDDKQSAAAFLPAPPTQYPVRPAEFSVDRNTIRFDQTDDSARSAQVTLSANNPGFKAAFRIVQPEATRHFKVEPASGTLESGKPVILTVRSCPEAIPVPRRNTGAFAVRLANGFSRPVSVTVDTRKHPRLLKPARAKAVYGKVNKTGDASMDLTFDVPAAGDYYLFVTFADWSCSRALVRCDDGEQIPRTIRIPLHSGDKPWVCLSELGRKKNRPIRLEAGQHTFHIERYKTYRKPAYAHCVLTTDPDVFRLAPEMMTGK
jgi:hypothetical protein